MSDVILYGYAMSTFVRTVRMVCVEKGIEYELEGVDLASEAYRRIHPFGKMPALRHGDFVLYETSAIARYLDEAFDGFALVPQGLQERARMEQWISVTQDYLYEQMVRRYVLPYVFPKGPEGEPDRGVIDGALPEIRRQLTVLDGALRARPFLAGEEISLADLFVAPLLYYVGLMPEGAELMAAAPNVGRLMGSIGSRESFVATVPPKSDA